MFAALGLRRRACRRLRGLRATVARRRRRIIPGLLRRRECLRRFGLDAARRVVRRRPVAALRVLRLAIVLFSFLLAFCFVAINPLGLWTRTTFISKHYLTFH